MPLCRLIYYSENQLAAVGSSMLTELNKILSTANRNNKVTHVTGALVFDEQWFIQILEGRRETVWNMFQKICEDERHSNVVLSEFVEVDAPVFGNWWMGLATRSSASESAFRPFVSNGIFNPRQLSAAKMLSLTIELAKLGLRRELASLDGSPFPASSKTSRSSDTEGAQGRF